MKMSVVRAAFLFAVGSLMIATSASAQHGLEPGASANPAFAHLATAPRSLGFTGARAVETKFITVRNTGTVDANVTVVAPSPPFTITSGEGSYSLAPKQVQQIAVQFAPSSPSRVRDQMTIQCTGCNATTENILVSLVGNLRASSATANALPFTVNAGRFNAIDQPFASVTICVTGTTKCTTVTSVLIDTGSFGLRIFGSVIRRLGIMPNMENGGEIGECAFFGSGSTWGAVSTVDVKMASEPIITVPIQVIDDTNSFAPAPSVCTNGSLLLSSPSLAGFNALLGVGQAPDDSLFTDYFNCSNQSCATVSNPSSADIVSNPAAALPFDNNGVEVSLASIPAGGARSKAGTLYFGIGTRTDNQPETVSTYVANSDANSLDYLNIDTVYKGVTAGGFFDTGSNGYFFNDISVMQCSDGSGFYCPSQTLAETATNMSVSGNVSSDVNFNVANADNLANTRNSAFDNLGGTFDFGNSYDGFDWGLPFFFGRKVYVGIDGTSSPLGMGPYTAY
jgi:hypothetical protein